MIEPQRKQAVGAELAQVIPEARQVANSGSIKMYPAACRPALSKRETLDLSAIVVSLSVVVPHLTCPLTLL